jgi:hypothetical protein
LSKRTIGTGTKRRKKKLQKIESLKKEMEEDERHLGNLIMMVFVSQASKQKPRKRKVNSLLEQVLRFQANNQHSQQKKKHPWTLNRREWFFCEEKGCENVSI